MAWRLLGLERILTVYGIKNNLQGRFVSYNARRVAEKKPIPVRLSEEAIGRLDSAAKRMGSDRSSLIRMLVSRWLDYFERAGADALPFDFETALKSLDGRTTLSRAAETAEKSELSDVKKSTVNYKAPPRKKAGGEHGSP
jgi:hypothetical protein